MYTGGTNRLYHFIALTQIYSKAANRDPSVYGKEQLMRTQMLGFPSAICKSFSGCSGCKCPASPFCQNVL